MKYYLSYEPGSIQPRGACRKIRAERIDRGRGICLEIFVIISISGLIV